MIARTVSLSFIVLTFNEEKNLDACLSSAAGWAKEVFVVDSGSTDRTIEIAERYGAQVFAHAFETHAKQWQWALENLPLSTDWILALDADQQLTAELREEIGRFLHGESKAAAGIAGCYVRRRQVFRGRWIKHGGYYPKYLLKMFRRDAVQLDEGDLVDHHFRVRGNVVKFGSDIIEDNRNEADISVWIAKHNRYAGLQAQEEMRRQSDDPRHSPRSLWASPDERVLWLKQLWARLPLYSRPLAYFLYRYLFRLGFLDGKEGFIFHFLQAYWYRLLVDIKIEELRGQSAEGARIKSSASGSPVETCGRDDAHADTASRAAQSSVNQSPA